MEPPSDGGYNDAILKYTLLRPLIIGSWLKAPGKERHDAEEAARLRATLEARTVDIKAGLNSPWYLDQGVHYCYSSAPGQV